MNKKLFLIFLFINLFLNSFSQISNEFYRNYGFGVDFIKQKTNGDFISAGRTQVDVGIYPNITQEDRNYISSINSNGNVNWQRVLNFTGLTSVQIKNGILDNVTEDVYILGTGEINSVGFSIILKVNNTGVILWSKRINNAIFNDIKQITNSEIVLAGQHLPTSKAYLLGINTSNGNIVAGHNLLFFNNTYFSHIENGNNTEAFFYALGKETINQISKFTVSRINKTNWLTSSHKKITHPESLEIWPTGLNLIYPNSTNAELAITFYYGEDQDYTNETGVFSLNRTNLNITSTITPLHFKPTEYGQFRGDRKVISLGNGSLGILGSIYLPFGRSPYNLGFARIEANNANQITTLKKYNDILIGGYFDLVKLSNNNVEIAVTNIFNLAPNEIVGSTKIFEGNSTNTLNCFESEITWSERNILNPTFVNPTVNPVFPSNTNYTNLNTTISDINSYKIFDQCCTNPNNLIQGGDFESPISFTTDFTNTTTQFFNKGFYSITNLTFHSGDQSDCNIIKNHGNIFCCDYFVSGNGQNILTTNVNGLDPNKKYRFCFETLERSISPTNSRAFNLIINGQTYFISTPADFCEWNSHCIEFFPTTSSIQIQFQQPILGSNFSTSGDFTLDNLSLREVGCGQSQCVNRLGSNKINNNLISLKNDELNFEIFPNPTTQNFTIGQINLSSLDHKYSYSVYDLSGRICKSGEFANESYNINVSDLNPGIYFINLSSGTISKTKKVIIQ